MLKLGLNSTHVPCVPLPGISRRSPTLALRELSWYWSVYWIEFSTENLSDCFATATHIICTPLFQESTCLSFFLTLATHPSLRATRKIVLIKTRLLNLLALLRCNGGAVCARIRNLSNFSTARVQIFSLGNATLPTRESNFFKLSGPVFVLPS